MMYYIFGTIFLLSVTIFFGSLIVMSILTNIGIKYKANLMTLSAWALVAIVLGWIFWINAP